MRFQRLHIPAFGPFTDLEFKFPSKDHDLHVIYGDNEAGKSSLLRAIRDLLFGIHGQSPDNFLHKYKDLRLTGEIVNRAGEELIFQRRKGTRNTLLDKEGNSISSDALLPFLGSIDPSYFSAMFGLGSTELREGAGALLKGEGEMGNALFSASMGGTPIQRVLESLVEESGKLYRGRSTIKVSIRPAIKSHKDLLRQSRESMVNPKAWNTLIRDLEEQMAVRNELEDEVAGLERELAWIERCEDALPTVGLLGEEIKVLGELPELPDLSSDFVERARSARESASDAEVKVKALDTRVAQLESDQAECFTSPDFLTEAEDLDILHQDLGAYRTRKKSLTTLKIKLAGMEPVLKAGMKSLHLTGDLESLETLSLGSAAVLNCEEAAEALQKALGNRETSTQATEELRQKIETCGNDLKSLPDTDLNPLREALAVAAEATDASKTLAAGRAEVEGLIREVAAEHTLVTGAPEDLDATAALAVPSSATIRKYRDGFERIRRDIQQEKDKHSTAEKTVTDLQAELNRLERRGELPTEASLNDARSHRDRGWQLVLSEWKGKGTKEDLDPDSPLEEAFPQAITKADDIADQLRLEAESVAQAEEKRLQISHSRKLIEGVQDKLKELESSEKEYQDSWESEWSDSGIKPKSPDEMEEVREAWMEFKGTLRRLRSAESSVKTKTTQTGSARKELAAVLDDSEDKDFGVLFEAARKRVQKGEKMAGKHSLLSEQLQTHRKQLESSHQKSAGLSKAVETATTNWKLQCQKVNLPDDLSPESGLTLLEERRQLLDRFDNWKESSGESKQIAEEVHRYEQSVSGKAAALKMNGDTTQSQEAGLWSGLTKARDAQTKHNHLAEQIRDARHELGEAKQKETQAIRSLEELLSLAGLKTVAELEPLLANLEKRNKARNQIDTFRQTLGGLARGQSVDEFSALVQAENADELPQRTAQLERSNAEKKTELQRISDIISQQSKEKGELEKAGDQAADFRQQAESVAAQLKQDASQYVRLRLATHFLQTQIERFREENQGPLLKKSGEVFRRMTGGSFDGLGAEFNDRDVPILVGRRPDGSNVPVEGMSDGSRDQLYLALRLAALDSYSEEHEPMPLILDDLLITFDDERAKAILPQLTELATRTQILLFTHHEHLVELCRQTLEGDHFHLHRLGHAG